MAVVERQESVDGQLRPEIIVLPRQQLLAHSGTDLRLEVQDGAKAQITSLSALVVLSVLDATATSKGVHARVNILVEMQALLRLGDTAASRHVQRVQEIRVSVVQLSADPGHRPRRQSTERLLLSSGQITQDTDVLRENVLAGADNSDGRALEVIVVPLCVRALTRHGVLLELGEHVPDLQALFEVVVLIRVDELQVLASVKDDRVVLVVRLSISQNRVAWQFDAEFGPSASSLGYKFTVAIDERRKDTGVTALLAWSFLF